MKALFAVFSLLLLFACGNQPARKNENTHFPVKDTAGLRLLITGIPPVPEYENARDTIARKWGIQFIWVAGCIVSEKLADSIDRCNLEMEKRMQEKYGKDWYLQFDKDIRNQIIADSLRNHISKKL
ncbi:MAG: hypothetical protein K1X92_03040 [Bacteroidia bacterium]|nr:hypothetical protein [Bacteroidia bacterium]